MKEKLESEIDGLKRRSAHVLERMLEETDQKLHDELEQKIEDLKQEYAGKLKEERKDVARHNKKLAEEEEDALIRNIKDKVRKLRDDAELDEELVQQRERAKHAEDDLKAAEHRVERARNKYEAFAGKGRRED